MTNKLEPDMIEESFWAHRASNFIEYIFLYCHFAITRTLGSDLDGLENGTCENCEMNFSNVDK